MTDHSVDQSSPGGAAASTVRRLKWMRHAPRLALVFIASLIVTLGYESDLEARNNSNRWDEECWFEGCDNEEREEMWFNGDALEEGINESSNKTGFAGVFEVAELASPSSTGSVAWGYCQLMMEDLDHLTTLRALAIRDQCSHAWSKGYHRNH